MNTAWRLLTGQYGLDPASFPVDAVARATAERQQGLGLTAAAYDAALLADPAELARLAELLLISETWFLRDHGAFRFLREHIRALPSEGRRELALLSVGCASGEEPYSLVITLAEAGVPPGSCPVDAFDVSARALALATAARYTRNALRGVPAGFCERWFTPDGDGYRLAPAVSAAVRFRAGNILNPPATGRQYDVVFCRNLMIYLTPAARAQACRNLRGMLRPGGMLIAGAAETSSVWSAFFVPAGPPDAFAYRSSETPALVPASPVQGMSASAPAVLSLPVAPAAPPQQPGGTGQRAASAPAASNRDLFAAAQACADRGDLAAAAQYCDAALTADPGHADGWCLRGIIHQAAANPHAAADCFARALDLLPDHYEALLALSLLREQAGEHELAARLRRQACPPAAVERSA